MEPVYINTAKMLKAMSDPKRLRIVDMLSCGELCGCKILEEFHITQPTLSHDMKVLSEAGIVKQRREGKNIYYSLNTDALSAMHRTLGHMFEDKPDCICHRPEQKELEGNGVNHTKLYVLTGFLDPGRQPYCLNSAAVWKDTGSELFKMNSGRSALTEQFSATTISRWLN